MIEKTLQHIPIEKRHVVAEIVRALSTIQGIQAVVLGGSYARTTAHANSDVDLGIYYYQDSPPSIDEIRIVANLFDTSTAAIITNFYEWGPWVNGGAWINSSVGKIDFIYRNIDQVKKVIQEAQEGIFEWHFVQQPPYGFHSVTYLAETQACQPLYELDNVIHILKESIKKYPLLLRKNIIREHMWYAEFSLVNAYKYAALGDIYSVAGCITRICACLTQLLFALNYTYFITDKGALDAIEGFAIKPHDYKKRVDGVLSHIGSTFVELTASLLILKELMQEIQTNLNELYTPKYKL